MGKLFFLEVLSEHRAFLSLNPRTEAFCFYDERQMSHYCNYTFKISVEVSNK